MAISHDLNTPGTELGSDLTPKSTEETLQLTEDFVHEINARPTEYLGVPNIYAPYPGVSSLMLQEPSFLEAYINSFFKLDELKELHPHIFESKEAMEGLKERMMDYTKSPQFLDDLAKIELLKEKNLEPIIVGGNMAERVLPLAFLYGLPVYQAPPVKGDWKELDTQIKELDRNLSTLHEFAQKSPKTVSFVWIGMDLSREAGRLEKVNQGESLSVNFGAKEIQLIQKLTHDLKKPAHFEYLVKIPQPQASNAKMAHGIAGFDYQVPKELPPFDPNNVIDLNLLQKALNHKITGPETAYLFSLGAWQHINTDRLHDKDQKFLLECIKEALCIFRSSAPLKSTDIVDSAFRAYDKGRKQ